jgi:hypothetical protein
MKEMLIKIINSYNKVYLKVNELNNVIKNESKENYINTLELKQPIDLLNKELINSKSLLENFFIKFNENKNYSPNSLQNVRLFK